MLSREARVRRLGRPIARQSRRAHQTRGLRIHGDARDHDLDLGDVATASDMIANLYAEFPASHRVARLEHAPRGLGRFRRRDEKFRRDWKESPRTSDRQAQGGLPEAQKADAAIEVLCEHLDSSWATSARGRRSGWYAERGSFAQSVFCWEEAMVAQPMMAHHHRRLAEVYYTWGGEENLRCARYSPRRWTCPAGASGRCTGSRSRTEAEAVRDQAIGGSGSGSIDEGRRWTRSARTRRRSSRSSTPPRVRSFCPSSKADGGRAEVKGGGGTTGPRVLRVVRTEEKPSKNLATTPRATHLAATLVRSR